MLKITKEHLDKWKACNRKEGYNYDNENLLILSGGKTYMTPLEIALHEKIPIEDKIWTLLRPPILDKWFMEFVNKCVSRSKNYTVVTNYTKYVIIITNYANVIDANYAKVVTAYATNANAAYYAYTITTYVANVAKYTTNYNYNIEIQQQLNDIIKILKGFEKSGT